MTKSLKILIGILVIILIAGGAYLIGSNFGGSQDTDDVGEDEELLEDIDEIGVNETLEEVATDVINLIKDKDTEALALRVHPEKGVRFSPYVSVRENDVVLTSEEFENIFTNKKIYLWGYSDGSGFPINATFSDYYKTFVYSSDFANAEEISYDGEIIGKGNTINNIRDFYPEGKVVEYHFSGFDEKYGGMDWQSLNLVFENKDGDWYLVAVVHDSWTI